MRAMTKTAIIGGVSLLAAYLLAIRPSQKELSESKKLLAANEEIREKFDHLPLRAHDFLAGVPLHSLDFIELRGGREQMMIADIYRAVGLEKIGEVEMSAATKALFDLRGAIGKIMRWDDVAELVEKNSYLPRLTEEERTASLVPPGEIRGISRVLYCFENEMVLEIINRTVHCFWVLASEKTPAGYNLYNAVYVKNLNWRTPIYMTLVSPILKNVIYPAIDKSIRRNWRREFPNETMPVKAAV